MQTHTYRHICLFVYAYINLYVYTFIHLYVYTCMRTYVYMYICIYVYMYICIYGGMVCLRALRGLLQKHLFSIIRCRNTDENMVRPWLHSKPYALVPRMLSCFGYGWFGLKMPGLLNRLDPYMYICTLYIYISIYVYMYVCMYMYNFLFMCTTSIYACTCVYTYNNNVHIYMFVILTAILILRQESMYWVLPSFSNGRC